MSDKNNSDYYAGRPTKYKKEYNQQIIDHMKAGKAAVEFAANIGVTEKTLFIWIEKNPSFLQSYELGRTLLLSHTVKTLRENMLSYKGGPKLNMVAYTKLMKIGLGKDYYHDYLSHDPSMKIKFKEKGDLTDKMETVLQAFIEGKLTDDQFNSILNAFKSISDIKYNEQIEPILQKAQKKKDSPTVNVNLKGDLKVSEVE